MDNQYEYDKLIQYLNILNVESNSILYEEYKEILSYEFIHFIPAVRFDSALFLRTLALMKQPKHVLEIGFGSGVSAYFIRKPIQSLCQFITLEKELLRYERGLKVLKNYHLSDVQLYHIDAFKYLDENPYQTFDYVFLDATKKDYLSYLPILGQIIKPGGFLVCDNTFFNGKVVQNEEKLSKSHKKSVSLLKEFNIQLSKEKKFETSYFCIGDGMSLSIRK